MYLVKEEIIKFWKSATSGSWSSIFFARFFHIASRAFFHTVAHNSRKNRSDLRKKYITDVSLYKYVPVTLRISTAFTWAEVYVLSELQVVLLQRLWAGDCAVCAVIAGLLVIQFMSVSRLHHSCSARAKCTLFPAKSAHTLAQFIMWTQLFSIFLFPCVLKANLK